MAADAAADELITAVIVDDHAAIAAGVRSWCSEAVPPIHLIDAGTGSAMSGPDRAPPPTW